MSPPALRALAPRSAAAPPARVPVVAGLRGLTGGELVTALTRLIRDEVAAELGYADPGLIEPADAFTDQGLDSVGSIQLRSRLVAATGVAMPATVVFDHPSPAELAQWLAERLP